MAPRAFFPLAVDVVAQGFIEHGLKLASLTVCDPAQGRKHLGAAWEENFTLTVLVMATFLVIHLGESG